MEFNEKHIEYTDNLLRYLMRSRPPEDSIGEEMLALYPCYVFLSQLKQHMAEDMNTRLQKQQAAAAAAKAQSPQNSPSEPVSHGKVDTQQKTKRKSKANSKKTSGGTKG